MNLDAAEHSAPPRATGQASLARARVAGAPSRARPGVLDLRGAVVPSASESSQAWRARARGVLADEQRRCALRDSVRALVGSRVLVWVAGSGTLALLGFGPLRKAFDPPGLTRGFGWLGDLLAGPAARWDSTWYLVIARFGYHAGLGRPTAPRAAFFPLYPLGLRIVGWLGAPPLLAGVLLSMAALAVSLYLLHRLTALELRRRGAGEGERARAVEVARLAVLLTAFAPMAFFLSAVYSESLFLALSLGLFWSARHGRWARAGLLAALAGATRSAGVALIVPALVLYLYGPREDGRPDRAAARAPAPGPKRLLRASLLLRPRYRVRRDVMWLALAPAGLLAFMGYLALTGGDLLLPFRAQALWGRHFAGPFAGVWDGLRAGLDGLRQLLSLQSQHSYYPAASGSPMVAAEHNVLLMAFMLAALTALVGVLRTLPAAYGAYVIAALAMPLSYPEAAQPLMSLPRFLLVLFPLTMWLAGWLASRPRARVAALVMSGASLAFFAASFSTWHWVA